MRKILLISITFVCGLVWFLSASGQEKDRPIEYVLNADQRWVEDFESSALRTGYKVYKLEKDPRIVLTLGIESVSMKAEFSKAEINAYADNLMKAKNFIDDAFNTPLAKLTKASTCSKDGVPCLSLEMEKDFKSGTFKLVDKYFMADDRTVLATIKWPKSADSDVIKSAFNDYQNIQIVKVK